MPSIIHARGIRFKYTQTWVLDGVSFRVRPGDYVGVIGPNGGGKTTLLKLILGLEKGEGVIKLFGQPIDQFAAWHKIGYLAQKARYHNRAFPFRWKK